MTRHSLVLTAGTPRTGWCDACLLPSVVAVDFYTLEPDGVHRSWRYRECQQCAETP